MMTMALPHFNIILGFIANIMSNIAFIPQILRSFRRKSVEDVSIGMFIILFITQLCWIGYSIPLHARQLWVSSLTEIILLIPIFILYITYKQPKKNQSYGEIQKDQPSVVGSILQANLLK
jgi:MtN3 and saliva related transmembrane protein